MSAAPITVLLPFRDAASTLDAALDGLLQRDDPSIQVLAIDDGSSDGGAERVHQRARTLAEGRLRLLSAGGVGLPRALQIGCDAARGDLIARMDADDISHPDRLARQRDALLAEPDLGALGCRVEAFAEPTVEAFAEPTAEAFAEPPAGDVPPASTPGVGEGMLRYVAWQNDLLTPEDHRRELFVESPLCHPSVLLRRSALTAVGGYRDFEGPEDYDLWLRLDAAGFGLAKLPERLLRWRHSAGRSTFRDPRYVRARFVENKAPFLAARIATAIADPAHQPARTTVVWGAGATGRRLARSLEPFGFRASAFIDIDPRKLGREARGAPIVSRSFLDPAEHFVVAAVGARGARAQIRRQLAERGFVEGTSFLFAA